MESTTCQNEVLNRGAVLEFIQERKYLKNVTTKTLAWYGDAFKAFTGCETEREVKQRIMELRQRGVSPVSLNSWLRCMNAYFNWNGAGFKIGRLKEEQKILATLTQDQVKHFIAFKPQGINETRAHMVALLILDGGYRISEVLALRSESCDFENLSVKVKGKEGKHLRVPVH